ncbi:class I SAM-dependent methyltransferase [Bacillus spongiae]|uniref:Class I SAM-dependent methyltransferase n=1 Tax=Bacillus spongiae TaxID=2683610 RepID=A0ABU8HAD2_9BACI
MLSKQGFDLWANNYDQTVQLSEENNLYPFAGYKEILNQVYNEAMKIRKSTVLDIGFGTGVLTTKLYDHDHQIDGMDFSDQMISIAKMKMPMANLMKWDITTGLPESVKEKKYDSIISTYALHHLSDIDKVALLKDLLQLLTDNGKILIGDIAFQTREDLEACKKKSLNYWDEGEFYFVFEEISSALSPICNCEFHQVSHCGGVLLLTT